MTPIIRPCAPTDADALAGLHARAFDPAQLGLAYWRGARNAPPNLCLVAEVGAGASAVALAGYCDGFLAGEGGDVASIATDPSRRGQGLGRALLAAFLTEARARGASVIHLEVSVANIPAIGLYRSLGFARVGTRRAYYADGTDAAVMAAPLEGAGPGA